MYTFSLCQVVLNISFGFMVANDGFVLPFSFLTLHFRFFLRVGNMELVFISIRNFFHSSGDQWFGKMGFGQAEQHCTHSVHMSSCLYSTVQLQGASLASVEVWLTFSSSNFTKIPTPNIQTSKQHTKLQIEQALPVKKTW